MKIDKVIGITLFTVALLMVMIATPFASADTLQKSDFSLGSFAKSVDYYDYVRNYASANNITLPSGFANYHANTYLTYINTSGVQVLYAGLENVTHNGSNYLNIPMQSIIMHYKTNESQDVIAESTFLMLMAFQESPNSSFPGSPTINDTLYASFSLGYDLSFLNATLPALNSQTELIPLTHSEDNITWTWGMTYTNMTALWWKTDIDPSNPHSDSATPVALSIYDELSFTYTLTINPTAQTAILTENHVIGRMRDLFIGASPFLWVRYDSTGMYGLLGRKLGDTTIYDFIQNNGIKMSLVNYQTLIMANHQTNSVTSSGENATQTETPTSSIATYSDEGEKIFYADFGTNQNYDLYNYTADPTETTYNTYQAVTRTAKAADFAGNTLFDYQTTLARFLPLVVAHMYPNLYAKAQATISDLSKANYFYITSYPQYGGYKIVQDPTFTAYIAAPQATTTPTTTPKVSASPASSGLIIIAIIIALAIVIVSAALMTMRRKNKR
jgi:hypothetical protein